MSESLYIGIDVAQAQLDIACRPTSARWTVPYTTSGIGRLVRRLRCLRPALIVLEATGGLELNVASELAAAALSVAVVNPRQVRNFAKATGATGEDGCAGRGSLGAVCGSRAAARPSPA